MERVFKKPGGKYKKTIEVYKCPSCEWRETLFGIEADIKEQQFIESINPKQKDRYVNQRNRMNIQKHYRNDYYR